MDDIDGDKQNASASLGKGYALGLTVLSISAQIVVFPLAGLWVDKQLGTGMLFGAVGFVAGMYSAIRQLLQLTKKMTK